MKIQICQIWIFRKHLFLEFLPKLCTICCQNGLQVRTAPRNLKMSWAIILRLHPAHFTPQWREQWCTVPPWWVTQHHNHHFFSNFLAIIFRKHPSPLQTRTLLWHHEQHHQFVQFQLNQSLQEPVWRTVPKNYHHQLVHEIHKVEHRYSWTNILLTDIRMHLLQTRMTVCIFEVSPQPRSAH